MAMMITMIDHDRGNDDIYYLHYYLMNKVGQPGTLGSTSLIISCGKTSGTPPTLVLITCNLRIITTKNHSEFVGLSKSSVHMLTHS
jgi:hypothetical protein